MKKRGEKENNSSLVFSLPILMSCICLLASSGTAATTQVDFEYRNGFDYEKSLEIGTRHALTYLESEITAQPKNVNLRFALGSLYWRSQPEKAKQQFEEIIKIDPNHSESYFLLGILALSDRDFKNISNYLERTIRLNPKHVRAYNTLGMIYAKTNQLERAVQLLEKAKAQVKDEESFYFNQTLMLFQEKDQYEAIVNNMEMAIKLSPKEEYFFLLGVAYQKQRKFDDARVTMQKVVDLNPKNVNALMVIATTYKEAGDLDQAIAIAEKAREIDPGNKAIEAEIQEYQEEYKRLRKNK